jgi:peptidoglycan/xylan/chitin deacetylase (PgdA/CDA1 family)
VEKAERQMTDAREQRIDDGGQRTDDRVQMTDDRRQKIDERGQVVKNTEMLFRPPYGKITSKQAKLLQKKGYQIIMWDVLSGDFDQSLSQKKCLENVLKNTKPGSIIVFHDSLKAEENLRYVLPKTLAFFKERGFELKSLN